jgi:hypothetical protein
MASTVSVRTTFSILTSTGSTAMSLSCFVVQTHQSNPRRSSILVSCTFWKWSHRLLALWRTKTRYLKVNVPLKPQVKAEHSHGSCKDILGVVDGQRVW